MSWIDPEEPAVKVYESVREALLECRGDRLGKDWSSMYVCGFALKEEEVRPTVVVAVKPRARCDWRELEGEMRGVLGVSRFGVEVLPGRVGGLDERYC